MPTFGIYWKQLLSFVGLAIVVGAGFFYVQSQQSEAATALPSLPTTGVATLNIDLLDGGKTLVDGESYGGFVLFAQDRDEFDLQVYDGEGKAISQLTVSVNLPRDVDASQVVARHFSTADVVRPDPIFASSRQITFTALGIGPNSDYRIEIILPKGSIKPSLYRRFVGALETMSATNWLIIALILPLVAAAILAVMYINSRRSWRKAATHHERSTPPDDTPPSVVGVLLEGRVSPRSLAASLLNLANRGQLIVAHRQDGFTFGRPKKIKGVEPAPLSNFERILMDKIFLEGKTRSTEEDIQLRIGRHVYSRKVAEIYLHIYESAVKRGWFVRDPQALYQRYRYLSLGVIAGAILGFLISLILGPDPRFYLLGWTGLFFVGLLMYRITPLLPRRTPEGDEAFTAWSEFKNFLVSKHPFKQSRQSQEIYEQYLPYAIALGVEVEWTKRFVENVFQVPNWFISDDDITAIEDFANSIFPLVGEVAYDLSRAREPHAI